MNRALLGNSILILCCLFFCNRMDFSSDNRLISAPKESGLSSNSIDRKDACYDAAWGVLVLNTDKKTYLPGETVRISIAVLDEQGMMACEADLALSVFYSETEGSAQKPLTILTSKSGAIRRNSECYVKNSTEKPDFETEFTPGDYGHYFLNLSAETKNGKKTITRTVQISKQKPFEIKRNGPTRIFPLAEYSMRITVTAHEDFTGIIQEPVPEHFRITGQTHTMVENKGTDSKKHTITLNATGKTRILSFKVHLKKGDSTTLTYQFIPPSLSPALFKLGMLTFSAHDNKVVYREPEPWWIASDATTTIRPDGDGTVSGAWIYSTGTTYWERIDEDPDAGDDGQYIEGPNCADATIWIRLADVPADFSEATAVEIKVMHMENSSGNDYLNLSYQIVTGDNSNTGITDATTFGNAGTSYSMENETVAITGTNTAASWNAAYLKIFQDYTQRFGADATSQGRITSVEVNITYSAPEDYDTWTHSKDMYINTTASGADVDGDVADFPLLLRLTSANFNFSQAKLNGEDIRFAKSDGSHLSYEIEAWDSTNASAALWIKMDTVFGDNRSQYFKMHWGKSDATSKSSSSDVFAATNNYSGVWHLNEQGNTTALDATSAGNNGTPSGFTTSSDVSGVIGIAREFNGADPDGDYIELNNNLFEDNLGGGGQKATVSFWVKADATSFAKTIIWEGESGANGWGTEEEVHVSFGRLNSGAQSSNVLNFFFCDNDDYESSGNPVDAYIDYSDLTNWHYVSATLDNSTSGSETGILYVDGVPVSSSTGDIAISISQFSANTRFGGPSANQRYFDGILDEVSIADTTRSADWIKLCYETQKQNANVVVSKKIWSGEGEDNNWSTAANWNDNTVPATTDDVFFNNTSNENCSLDVSVTVNSITFSSSYSGDFDFGADTLRINGNADFSTGGTITPDGGAMEFTGTASQTVIPKSGQSFPVIIQNGSGGTVLSACGLHGGALVLTSGTFDLGDDALTHRFSSIDGSSALDFGTSTLQVTGNANLSSASVTVGTGTLQFIGSGVQTFTPSGTLPAISHTGTGTLDLAANLTCASFVQSAGVLDFNGNDITTTGDFTINNGTTATFVALNGSVITAGGNASFNGQSTNLLNMNASGTWDAHVSGNLTASYAVIKNSDASGYSQGLASLCIDSLSNTNWTFINENYDDWSYSGKVYINTTSSGADVSDNIVSFPLLVRLNSGNFNFSQLSFLDGRDIRFATSDGTHLNYQIERCDGGTPDSAEIWVKVDTVYGNNLTQYFMMYWGKSDAVSRSNGTMVFETSNDFCGVWHLDSTSGVSNGSLTPFRDATSNGYHGMDYVSAGGQNGAIYRGQQLDGNDDYIRVGTFDPSTTALTLSAWVYWNGDDNSNQAILSKRDAWDTPNNRWQFYYDNGNNHLSAATQPSGTSDFVVVPTINDWTHLVVTSVNGSTDNTKCYMNGVRGGGDKTYTWDSNTGAVVRIGNVDGNESWSGYIDEARISKTIRSADWVKLCYETQKPGADVLTCPKVWDGGGSDENWSTAANWSGDAVPGSTQDVLFDGSSNKNCTVDGTVTVKSITFTSGYTGAFNFGAGTLNVTGNAIFSTGGAITAGSGTLGFTGTSPQTFTPKAGQSFPAIAQNGSGGTTILSNNLTAGALALASGTLNIGAGLSHSVSSISGSSGGGINFSSSTLSATGTVNLTNITVTAGTGTLRFSGSGDQTFTPVTGCPAISHTGSNTLVLGAVLNCVGFSQSGGVLNFNGYNITTTENFTVTNGTSGSFTGLAGRTITIGKNGVFAGQSGNLLNMNTPGLAHHISASGGLAASYANLDSSDATGGSAGNAAVTCAGTAARNPGWVFSTENYEADWTYSKRVVINTTPAGANVQGNIYGFPLLLRLSGGNFTFSQAKRNGEDVRFASGEGIPLSYEIENWDSANAAAAVWVLMPTVYGNNAAQFFTMYWGNTGASSSSSGSSVFVPAHGFLAAYHLGGNLADATGNGHTGTDNNTQDTGTGIIGRARAFDGSSHYFHAGDLADRESGAVSFWFRPKETFNSSSTTRGIYGKKQDDDVNITLSLRGTDFNGGSGSAGCICTKIDQSATATYNSTSTTEWTSGVWYHVFWTWKNGADSVYVNGSLQHSVSNAVAVTGAANDEIGRSYYDANANLTGGGPRYFNGTLDEFRLDSATRSCGWATLCYETQKESVTCVVLSNAPLVTGPNDAGLLAASQTGLDTVELNYEVDDPDGGTVTISAQYKPSGGSWAAMTNTAGEIGAGISATDGSVTRTIKWGARDQLGGNVEAFYFIRVIADDGAAADTAASDSFSIDTRPPQGMAAFTPVDTTGNSVQFTWTCPSEANFDHYEIWYDTISANVINRSGSGVQEWDENDDEALATRTTSTAEITGLLQNKGYYFKIWAIDTIGNEASLDTIKVTTKDMAAPVWTRTSLGTVRGGSVGLNSLFIGTGASAYALLSVSQSNGNTLWSYSTLSYGPCNMPANMFIGGSYKIIASAGNHVVGRQDNGTGSSQLFTPIDLGSTAGNPGISPNDTTFFVAYANSLTHRKISNGSVMSGFPVTITNISTGADPVVFNDEAYVATTDGTVQKVDSDGTPVTVWNGAGGSSIDLPLLASEASDSVLYVTPDNTNVYAIKTSNMSTIWTAPLDDNNTGPAFLSFEGSGDRLYAAAAKKVYKITDNGGSAGVTWSCPASDTVLSGPIMYESKVYFGCKDSSYYVLSDDGASYSVIDKWPYTTSSGNANTGPWISVDHSRVFFGTTGGRIDAFALEE